MNYTEKYHLPQWEETDRVMRTDFNQMCADIEAGLGEAFTTAASATAAAAASAANAQTTADNAVTAAAAAQQKADAAYAPDQPPYVVGTYTGINENLPITLGFRPSFVLISCADGQNVYSYITAAENGVGSTRLIFTATGFTVKQNFIDTKASGVQVPYTNSKGVQYIYIAFR